MNTTHAHAAVVASGRLRVQAPVAGGALDVVTRLLAQADVRVNGDRPWDMQIHDPRTATAAWPRLGPVHGERFGRMWRYYLLACAGTFRARTTQLWQIVLSRDGVPGGYRRTS